MPAPATMILGVPVFFTTCCLFLWMPDEEILVATQARSDLILR
jgi:hypothetical protein